MHEIINGDALTELRKLKERGVRVDAVLADPPYCSGGSTTVARTSGTIYTKYLGTKRKTPQKNFRDNLDPIALWDYSCAWMRACFDLMGDGYLFCCSDWRQMLTFGSAIQVAGFKWAGVIPWHKKNARPCQGRFTPVCEYVVYGFKGAPSPKYAQGIVTAPPPSTGKRIHPTEKPVALWEHLLTILPDEARLVVDPFCGSASSGEAAIARGLDYIGIELDQPFAEMARARLEEH